MSYVRFECFISVWHKSSTNDLKEMRFGEFDYSDCHESPMVFTPCPRQAEIYPNTDLLLTTYVSRPDFA